MEHRLLFVSIVVVVWFIVIRFLPAMILSVFKRAILVKGFGEGPIPMNTLYTQPQEQFADPLHSAGSRLTITGVNRDTIITIGWLDLRKGPLLLHVPDMSERYYSLQFTDPSKNAVFAYVGKRTTGTGAGAYLISGPGWNGNVPQGLSQISSPNHSVLLVGRVLVSGDRDLPAAYSLSKQIKLTHIHSGVSI
ncbi:MAG: DUF1254 domain-containing protein [Clostridiales bacterium]|nr:DUF1254 domain-containing protein [Clostridiales bacterium]